MRIMPETSQIATILTLVMAVIFLFILITINIGNIAQEKTVVSNTSDTAALLLASMLGSLSNGLKIKFEIWGDKGENCELDLLVVKIIGAVILLVLSILATIATWGGAFGSILGAVAFASSVLAGLGSAAVFVGGVATAVTEPGSFKQAELQFQNMTFEERIKEQSIQISLYSLVGDQNKNCVNKPCLTAGGGDPALYGGCTDPQDLDMDGRTTGDCISCFAYWYTERLKSLPRKGDVVQAIFDALFFNPRLLKEGQTPPITGVKLPRIYVKKNEETWKADTYGFWIDTNGNKLADGEESEDPEKKGHLSGGYNDNPYNIAGVVYQYDIYFVDWLENRFLPLAKKLYDSGYGLSAKWEGEEGTEFDIDYLAKEVDEFEDGVAGLYGTDFDSKLQSFEEWMAVYYNGSGSGDWYTRMQEWVAKVDSWIGTLETRKGQINDCVGSCKAFGPYSCGKVAGEVCEQIYVPCSRWESAPCYDENDEEIPGDCGDWVDCSYCDPPTGWCNCQNGSELDGGRLCPSGHCPPAVPCVTPADGGKGAKSIPCCTIADNGLYYQLCPATGASPGGNSARCGAVPCPDTYYQCGYNPNNNVITREHAIEYLAQFKNDVQALMAAFKKGHDDAQLKESDQRLYEALYEWEDYAGRKGEVTSQRVKHAVYVKLSDNLKPNLKNPEDGFQLPYPHQYREWGWPSFGNRRCTTVAQAKGNFGIVVARYDQDVGTAENAPLRKLWIFKTRQKTSETEPAFTLSYIDPSQPVAEEARNFVLQNGIVSATKGYYGPGYTFRKEQIKERDPNIFKASEINKDIKIERAKWSDYIKIN